MLEWKPFDATGDAWDMLAGCETWAGACERSEALVHAARLDIDSSVGQFWDSHTDRALAPYLLAAAASNKPPSAIYAWIASQRVDEPQRILANAQLSDGRARRCAARPAHRKHPQPRPPLEPRHQPHPRALRPAPPRARPQPRQRLHPGSDSSDREHPATLYITIPADEQRRARAFVIALVEAAYLAAYRAGSIQPFDPPLLLLIDEAAHTAPLRDLPQMTQVARDAGIRIATSWQDASQIQHRYGRRASQHARSAPARRASSCPAAATPPRASSYAAASASPPRSSEARGRARRSTHGDLTRRCSSATATTTPSSCGQHPGFATAASDDSRRNVSTPHDDGVADRARD